MFARYHSGLPILRESAGLSCVSNFGSLSINGECDQTSVVSGSRIERVPRGKDDVGAVSFFATTTWTRKQKSKAP